MCDVDSALWLECDLEDKRPLALIEAAVDVGQYHKPATAIRNLAMRSRLPSVTMYQIRPVPPLRSCDDKKG